MAKKRPISDWPHLIGKPWGDLVTRELQDFFARLVASLNGTPSGFSDTPASKLGIGTVGLSGDPGTGWAAADHVHPSELTTKGSSITHNGSEVVGEPVGPDGTVLIADSSQPTGRKWGPAPINTGSGSNERLESHLLRLGVEAYSTRVLTARNFR